MPHDVPGEEAAIVWWGEVTPTANSADARITFNDTRLYVRISAYDRRLWYDTSPSPEDLTAWDAVSLYLDLDGNQGMGPDASSYRFDGQLNWWELRDDWQAAYQGVDGDWALTSLPFTTSSDWAGDVPNSNGDDRGWALEFLVPFASLGLAGSPPEGTVWGLGMAVHDRDDAQGAPIADQVWPEPMDPWQPATWGQARFGLPTYLPPPAVPRGTLTIRQGLAGAVVPDGMVGGSANCGDGMDYWTEWGEANYAGELYSNIQNLGLVGDWPCVSRTYVTFPLDTIPAEAEVLSATMILHQFGNAGQWAPPPGPQPSLIQVLTVSEAWDESTLTWNSSPLADESVSATWAYPLDPVPPWPGVPRYWDVSRAVAQARDSGAPLRLALYEADWALHGGKYFVSSDAHELGEVGTPTLLVLWGEPTARLRKEAVPRSADAGATIRYSLAFTGSGLTLTVADALPPGLGAAFDLEAEGTGVMPLYDTGQHAVTWTDTVAFAQPVVLRYRAVIETEEPTALVNTASLYEVGGRTSLAQVTVLANPLRFFVPLAGRAGQVWRESDVR